MNTPATIDKFVARLMMVSFFVPMQFQPVAVFATALYFIVSTLIAKQTINKQHIAWAFLLGSSYLLYLFAIPLTPPRFASTIHMLVEYRMSYLLLPIVFSLISQEKLRLIYNELAWFVYALIAVCVAANAAFAIKYLTLPTGFKGVTHVTYRIYFEEFCGHHPTYVSMYLVLAAGFLLVIGDQMNRAIKYLLFYVILALLLPLMAKSPLIALVAVFAHQAWVRRKTLLRYKWVFGGMLLVMIASYVFVPFVSQRLQEAVHFSGTSSNGNFAGNSVHERKMILGVDTDMLRHYWLTGVGPARLMTELKIHYFFHSLYYGRYVNFFDPHNEYLYQWLSFGLLGIVLFVTTLLTHLATSIKSRDYLYLYLLFIVFFTFFTESILTTQHGLIFFSFFASLFFFARKSGALTAGARFYNS